MIEQLKKVLDDQTFEIDVAKLQEWVAAEVKKSSQNKLADALDISRPTINRWLNGKAASITGEKIKAIAKFKKQSVDATFGWLSLPLEKQNNKMREQNGVYAASSVDERLALLEEDLRDLKSFINTLISDPACLDSIASKLRN